MFTLPKFSRCFPPTLSAITCASRSYISIFRSVRMSMWTMCNQLFATKYIFSLCNWFHMGRINTKAIATQMVNMKSLWYRTICKFIRKPMSTCRVFIHKELAVTSIGNLSCPKPTSIGLINFQPKSLFSRWSSQINRPSTIPTIMMRVAHTHMSRWVSTVRDNTYILHSLIIPHTNIKVKLQGGAI